MHIAFYTAKVAAWQQQERLNVYANNIANVNTFGFKAKRPAFSALMTGPVTGIEADLPRGVGARMVMAETDFSDTSFKETGLAFDYAISGSGFFALQDPVTGEYTFTRDGSFIKSEFQSLEQVYDEYGEPVLGEDGEPLEEMVTRWYLSDGHGRFVIGEDGQRVEVTSDSEPLPVGIFDFINYNGMQMQGDNTIIPVDKNGALRRGTGKPIQGYLEVSNTDLAYEIAKVIETQRSFSYVLKMVRTADEIDSSVNDMR